MKPILTRTALLKCILCIGLPYKCLFEGGILYQELCLEVTSSILLNSSIIIPNIFESWESEAE
jgi:hypothetical protein